MMETTNQPRPSLEERLFWQYARGGHLEEMRLLFRGGKLSPKFGDWNNVINHSLVQTAAMDAVGDALNVSPDTIEHLRSNALIHDWKKRLERKPGDFTDEQKAAVQNFVDAAQPDASLLAATEAGFSKKILDGEATTEQKLMFYIDDIARGSEIIGIEERISEAEKRNPMADPKWVAKLGMPYWDAERLAARKVEQELFATMVQKGIPIAYPGQIPQVLRKGVEDIAFGVKREKSDIPLSSVDIAVISEAQPGRPKGKNEDTLTVIEPKDGAIVLAIFDGATALSSVTGRTVSREQGGELAANLGAIGVERHAQEAKSAEELLVAANGQVTRVLKAQDLDPEVLDWRALSSATGTVVHIDKHNRRIEVSSLGDTACIIKKKDGSVELALPLDMQVGDSEALLLAFTIAHDRHISMQEALKDSEVVAIMERGRSLNNALKGEGQGVIDGRENAQQYITSRVYQLHDIEAILVCTDGLYLPQKDASRDPDWAEMMRIAETHGVLALYEKVFAMKQDDHTMERYPRFKIHDDATGIYLKFR